MPLTPVGSATVLLMRLLRVRILPGVLADQRRRPYPQLVPQGSLELLTGAGVVGAGPGPCL